MSSPTNPEYVLVQRSALTSAASSLSPSVATLSGPTPAQLAALQAIPRSGGPSKKTKNGKIVAKVFNPQAGRPQRTLTTPLQEFKCTMEVGTIWFTTSTSTPSFASSYITLNQFPDYSKYSALFDEYKFEQIEAWIEPSIILSSTVGSAQFFSAVDLDDANVPTDQGDVSMRQGVAQSEAGVGHYHKWRPYVANALYSGAFTSYGSEPSQWIDCASTTVQHFGLKAAVPAADGVARSMYLTIRALVSFRGSSI